MRSTVVWPPGARDGLRAPRAGEAIRVLRRPACAGYALTSRGLMNRPGTCKPGSVLERATDSNPLSAYPRATMHDPRETEQSEGHQRRRRTREGRGLRRRGRVADRPAARLRQTTADEGIKALHYSTAAPIRDDDSSRRVKTRPHSPNPDHQRLSIQNARRRSVAFRFIYCTRVAKPLNTAG